MANLIKIGERIKKHRVHLGMTREQLAETIGVTPRFCYDLEVGLKGMSLDTLCRICRSLDVSADYLLFGTITEPIDDDLTLLFRSCPSESLPALASIIETFIQAVSH